jgi:aryl-alcohol dehydrogenase-like predicted oxidoreductase
MEFIAMKRRILGAGGPVVSALGLGLMGMSAFYGTPNDAESIVTIHRALDLGVNLFDTADVYGSGHNEQLLGRALKGRPRDEAFVATKFGARLNDGAFVVDSSPAYAKQAVDASLTRLGLDHIDLYYVHRRNPQVPIEDTVGALSELVQLGKIRYIGLSEVKADTLRRAHAVHPISALQSEYSLWERSLEQEILPTARSLGVTLVPYSPVGRGFLAGTITDTNNLAADDYRRFDPRFQGENLHSNLRLAAKVRTLSAEVGITPTQLALAWLLHQGDDIIPIPGTKRVAYLEENAAAPDIRLSTAQLAALEEALPAGVTAGPRYPEQLMYRVNT